MSSNDMLIDYIIVQEAWNVNRQEQSRRSFWRNRLDKLKLRWQRLATSWKRPRAWLIPPAAY
jgi:hypothetical protein